MRPGLARGVRLVHDHVRDADALLYPEGTLILDEPAAAVVRLCDGVRSVEQVTAALREQYDDVEADDVTELIDDLLARKLLADKHFPIGLIAELTYRCPLRCTYCSNPVAIDPHAKELTTAEWCDVLDQARELGVLQVHFSGGEPLLRRDLGALATHARGLGMYTNLITSGIGLKPERLDGIDHVQLSIQDAVAGPADRVAGIAAYAKKLDAAAVIRRSGRPFTVNVVLHKGNVDRLAAIADLAAGLGADRLELAHTQFYGWGLRNRGVLMPSREQIDRAGAAAAAVHDRYGDRIEIVYVEPDHHTGRPKPCMNGWAERQFAVTPTGSMLPCLAAQQLPGPIPSVRTERLAGIWQRSELFNRFRGTAWMPSPCRDCALRAADFGGCRCQAFQLTGDAAATDPACSLSPHHDAVTAIPLVEAVPRRYS